MGRKARREKRLAQQSQDNHQPTTFGGKPLTGNMVDRISEIDKQERRSSQGTFSYPFGYGHMVSQGWQDNHEQVGYVKNNKDNEVFRCNSDDVTKECPVAEPPKVYVPELLWDEFIRLCKNNQTEWLAYLKGSHVQANGKEEQRFEITSCYFPPQTATGTHVDIDDDFKTSQGTIGAIHSHVGMQVFFSGEDRAHSNWPVEIVINNKAEYRAEVRYKLGCGAWAKHNGKVLLRAAPDSKFQAELDKAFAKGRELAEKRVKDKVGYKRENVQIARVAKPIIAEAVVNNPSKDDKHPNVWLKGQLYTWLFSRQGYVPAIWSNSEQAYVPDYRAEVVDIGEDAPGKFTAVTNVKHDPDKDKVADGDKSLAINSETGQVETLTTNQLRLLDMSVEEEFDRLACDACEGEGYNMVSIGEAGEGMEQCQKCAGTGFKDLSDYKEGEGTASQVIAKRHGVVIQTN